MSLLDEVLSKSNIEKAYRRVYQNKGTNGVDGVTVYELRNYLDEHIDEIREKIKTRKYKPSPVKRVYIPKDNGDKRGLGIPTFEEENNASGIKVTITYPEGCGYTLTCSYIKDNGEEVGVTSKSVDVNFETDGDVVAKVSDGTNSVSSSYTVVRYNLYVSSKGSDTTGRGTREKPYATLQKAYDEASYKANIYVMDNITVNSTTNFNEDKDITLTSYSTNDTINSIIRGTSLTSHIIDQTAGDLTLKNITVNGNNVEAQFAMINVGGDTTMEAGTTITKANNVNNYGGGISVNGGILTVSDGEITENKSPNSGGSAIFVYPDHETVEYSDTCKKGTVIMNGGKIYDNEARDGTIFNAGDFTMNNGEIYNNTSSANAGAIYNANSFIMYDGNIHNNESNTGGAIALAQSGTNCGTANIKGGKIEYNNAFSTETRYARAGGIFMSTNCDHVMNIGKASVSYNTSEYNGGGIEVGRGTLTFDGTTIDSNEATNVGGGVHVAGIADEIFAKLIIENATISNNEAGAGAGVRVTASSTITINNCKIINNSALNGGAGVEVYNKASVTMNGGEISGNTSDHYGAGVWIHGEPNSDMMPTFVLAGGIIKNNTASVNDGGIFVGSVAKYTYKSGVVCGNKPSNSYETSSTCPN